MKEMTREEMINFQMNLGRDLNEAKIGVFVKYGFSNSEISKITGLSETIVERIVERIKTK